MGQSLLHHSSANFAVASRLLVCPPSPQCDWCSFLDFHIAVLTFVTEPAILLMLGSIPKYADITASLLEFLVLIIEVYDVKQQETIKKGLYSSFKTILEKGVVRYDVVFAWLL